MEPEAVAKALGAVEPNTQELNERESKASHRIGFLGRRQQHMSFTASAKMIFQPKEHQSAGLVILQNGFQQLRMEYTNNESGNPVVRLVKGYMRLEGSLVYRQDEKNFTEEILAEIPSEGVETTFTIQAREQNFSFFASAKDKETSFLGETDGGFLGSETAGGFVGAYIGMFATGNGTDYEEYAAFDWFSYEGNE
jgi:alpha-N-arabinofuranosidase